MFSAQKFFDSEKNENIFLRPSPSIISSDPKSRKLHSHHLKMLGTGDDTADDEMIVDDDKEENEDDALKSTSPKLKLNKKVGGAKRKQAIGNRSSGKKQNTNVKKNPSET